MHYKQRFDRCVARLKAVMARNTIRWLCDSAVYKYRRPNVTRLVDWLCVCVYVSVRYGLVFYGVWISLRLFRYFWLIYSL